MSSLLLSLVVFFATRLPRTAAQGTNAVCGTGYDWMTNSEGQSPCLVSSYLFTPCSAPADSWVFPLSPGYHYNTPTNDPQSATPCRCNTVLFSMIAACATCQGQEDYIIPWSTYSQNCTTVYVQKYPEGIPSGTSVPAWAYLDITTNNTFNPAAAQAVAAENLPESTASSGATSTGTSLSSPPTVTSGSNGAPDSGSNSSTSSSKKSTNIGAIVGGVVGGVVGLLAIGLAAFFFIRHRRKVASYNRPTGPIDLTATSGYDNYPPYSDKSPAQEVSQPLAPSAKLYDPNDPSTFPTVNPYTGSVQGSTHPAPEAFSAGQGTSPTLGYPASVGTTQNPTYKGAPEL